MSPRKQNELLLDVVERIDAATRAEHIMQVAEVRSDSDLVEVALDAICYDAVVIGEAVKQFESAIFDRYPQIPWSDIARMRDRLAHHYYKVDSNVVRQVAGQPMQELRDVCERERRRISKSQS